MSLPLNRLLLDRDRELLQPVIDEMFTLVPEMLERKIGRANVQQAFLMDTVRKLVEDALETDMLCVGSHEDTAWASLVKLGYSNIIPIDPDINVSLEEYWKQNRHERYDVVFSTSVLEHVLEDDPFLSYFCDLLEKGGYGVLTCDYNPEYVSGMPVPATVVRQYTPKDIPRISEILSRYGCRFVDEHDLSGEVDFIYQGHKYAFLTLIFRKSSV